MSCFSSYFGIVRPLAPVRLVERSALIALAALALAVPQAHATEAKPRARDLGVPFGGEIGPLNAITDVAGVEIGHVTLIKGQGRLKPGKGPVRTGVTAILPRGKKAPLQPVFAGWFALNGNGEMTGTTWIEESGELYGPIMLTNTHSVGVVRDAVVKWGFERYAMDAEDDLWSLPVVAETWDGWLNDIYGFHVTPEHVARALESARGGAVPEGNVGGGTGMICYHFKGGIGTASRRVRDESGSYTLGVLVQANFGSRAQLTIAGVPIGPEITEHPAYVEPGEPPADVDRGSLIVVVATDAPLLPHQLERIARRAGLGMARTGGTASNDSGDIFIAFSTANPGAGAAEGAPELTMLPNGRLTPFFQATAEATEEAIVNALIAAESMTGANDRYVMALPHDRLQALLARHGRLAPAAGAADERPNGKREGAGDSLGAGIK